VALAQPMGRAELARLKTLVERLLKIPPEKAPQGSHSAALQVMMSIGQPGDVLGLTRLTGTKYPEPVRRDALLAIAGCLRSGLMPLKILQAILPIIKDGPSPALRSAALEVLSRVALPAIALDSVLRRCSSSVLQPTSSFWRNCSYSGPLSFFLSFFPSGCLIVTGWPSRKSW